MNHQPLRGPECFDDAHCFCAFRVLGHHLVAGRGTEGQHGDICVAVQEDFLDVGLTRQAVNLADLRIVARIVAAL